MGPGGKQLVDLLKASGVYGGNPECSDLQCKFGGTTLQHKKFVAGSCPPIQIQNCLNNASMNNQGKLQGAVSTDQANNCVQQNTTQNVTQQTPSQVQSQPSSQVQSQPSSQPSSPTTSPTSSQVQEQASSPTEEPAPQGKNNTMLYIIIGIVLLLVIIGVVVFLLMGDSSSPAAPAAPVASRVFSRRK
jgi:cobalamin biosynthesis Mg chelatase CobN